MANKPPSPHSQLWRWEVERYLKGLAGTVYSDTPPVDPAIGTLWFETDTGILWYWYQDQDSAQWVQVGGPFAGNLTAKPVNKFPNPCMQVSQELAYGYFVTTSGQYPADQCVAQVVGISFQALWDNQQTSPDGNSKYISICASTAKPTLAAGDYMQMVFPVEGYDIADLQWGTNYGVPAVLRFTAYAFNTGKYAFSIVNGAGTWSYCGSFEITNAYTATTFVFAIPDPRSPYDSWKMDNTLGLSFRVCNAAGSNFVGVAGWQSGNKMAPPGCVNGAAAGTQGTIYITDIGLYADPQGTGRAPPFERPHYEDALRKSRRYWQKAESSFRATDVQGYVGTHITYVPPMRVAPTKGSIVDGGTVSAANKFQSWFGATEKGTGVQFNPGANVSYYNYGFTFTANARLI